ncbi:MAG: short-subunit dehydrogenase [Bacteroidia bacterium]
MAKLALKYGPLALVTGASSGIGEQFARLLAQEGVDLIITARRAERLESLSRELQQLHSVSVTCVTCDLSDALQVDTLIEAVRHREPGLIISNAGYGVPKGNYLDIDIAALEAMYQANCIAPARLARALLPDMVGRGSGGIIFTGSIEGEAVFPYSASYAASKAFLHSLVLALWFELQSSGVDVLLLAPGATDTEAPLKQGISRDQLSGLMSPADVAGRALQQLGLRPQFIPGLQNRLMVALLRLLPRKLAIKAAGMGMQRAMAGSAAD